VGAKRARSASPVDRTIDSADVVVKPEPGVDTTGSGIAAPSADVKGDRGGSPAVEISKVTRVDDPIASMDLTEDSYTADGGGEGGGGGGAGSGGATDSGVGGGEGKEKMKENAKEAFEKDLAEMKKFIVQDNEDVVNTQVCAYVIYAYTYHDICKMYVCLCVYVCFFVYVFLNACLCVITFLKE